MKAVGIHKVYYSTNTSELVCENVKDMISIHTSAVSKHLEKIRGNILLCEPNKYYESLLKKYFPTMIRQHNLDSFIIHNFSEVLPAYKTVIKEKNNTCYVYILDDNNNEIIKAQVIE